MTAGDRDHRRVPSVEPADRGEVEVLVAAPDFETDAGSTVAIEYEAAVAEDPVNEVRGRTVERDDLNRAAEQPLQCGFDGELGSAERRGWVFREEDAHVDVALGPRLAPRHAAEEVDGNRAARVVLEEGLQAGFDGGSVHGPMIPPHL